MRGYWDNCLTVGNNVNLGQLYDMQTNGISSQRMEYQLETHDKDKKSDDFRLISRINTDNQIPQLLKVSKQFLLREICYPTSNFNEFLDFVLPSASKYILLRFENVTQTICVKNVQQSQLFSHVISKIDYGSIVFIRIVPSDEDINIDELFQSLQSGAKHNAMLEHCCNIESFANWETRKSHKSINDAIEYAEILLKKKNYCKVRYTLTPITAKPIWQQDDDATMSALQKLFRLQMAKNVLQIMLHRLDVDISIATFQPISMPLEERVIENYNQHKFFKLNNLDQNEFITVILDMFTNIYSLELACFEYMRKRNTSTFQPINPNIIRILDTLSMTIISLSIRIFNVFDETFIEDRKGIVYFNLKTNSQETYIFHSSSNFILINGERNYQLIDSFKKLPKYSLNANNFLIAYLASKPQTNFWRRELQKYEDEKVIMQIFSCRYFLGIAKPTEFGGKPALYSGTKPSQFQCRCKSTEWRIWICYVCDEILTTESSGKPSCKCGKHDITKLSLKCFNEYHGPEYIDEKVGGLFQSLVTTVFGCSTSGGQRYESIEMGQELYEISETRNGTNIQTSKFEPYTVNIKVDTNTKEKPDLNYSKSTVIIPTTQTIKPKHEPVSEIPTHSYNLRSTTVQKEKPNSVNNNDEKSVKQRSLTIDTKRFLVDPKYTVLTETSAFKEIPNSTTTTSNIKIHVAAAKENAPQKIITAEKFQPVKKINIAVIGQTGVGKSTLLNAVSNYLKFDTAQDALNNDLEYIIPCQFKVFYDDFSEKLVSIGMPNENEIYETALSTTQECQDHSFEFNGYKINFIDTPGLSDTSGIEKDAKNLEKIRSFICSLDSLHGICFVVKANEARMDIGFANSMNDLLSIFPKSALSKVIFFMTHSRGTLYGPGDSMTPLKIVSDKLLKSKNVTFPLSSENIFCVDNESFLFLCAKNRGIEYSGVSMEDFETSWKKSKQATQRFFDKVKTLETIKVMDVGIIKDLIEILNEQKQVLSKNPSETSWFSHFLTAKMLDSIETGNSSKTFLDFIDMDLIKKGAKQRNIDLKNLTNKIAIQGVFEFIEANKNQSLPRSQNFVQKCKTMYSKV